MHLTLGISNLSEAACDRKLYGYIITRLKKKKKREDGNSVPAMVGKILHSVLQISMKRLFSFVQYYFHRKKMTIKNSIEATLNYCLQYWDYLLQNRVKSRTLEPGEYSEIMDEVKSQIGMLAGHCETLISRSGSKIGCIVIDDEFQISYEILPGILVVGKIDLVCYKKSERELKFIEYKTGRPKPTQDNRQIRLYKEIFNKKQNREVTLEVWNSKLGIKKNGFAKIKTLRRYKNPELGKLKEIIMRIIRCRSLDNLPDKIHFIGSERICEYCDYCHLLNQIFEATKIEISKKSKLDYYFK